MKRGPHYQEKKALSTAGLLNNVKDIFDKISNNSRANTISISDCLMSALAMFSLKAPSLLAFDKQKQDKIVSHNLRSLYKIENVPCDTYMREVLDEVDPRNIRDCFLSIFYEAQRGKLLESYEFLDKSYLCLIDGTEIFNSEKVHCKNCLEKHHKDGRVTYHHQILGAVIAHPEMRQVIPLCPEPITKQDGSTKNDCERNACYRFLSDLKKEHPRLKLTIVSDALSANAPQINEILSYDYNFIINVKPDGNRTLFEWVKGITKESIKIVDKNRYIFRYANNVSLNDTKDSPKVNFFECDVEELSGKKIVKKHFSWVTNINITDDNVYKLMCGGRARWKIENETFNTLKNQGYQFEHNFGHGKKNLHTIFAFLMMIAFLIDQIQEATCGLFQAALKKQFTRRALWEKLRSFFYLYLIESWADLWGAMGRDFEGAKLNSA
jgi:hypothetical protein